MRLGRPPQTPEERLAHGARLIEEYNVAMSDHQQPINEAFGTLLETASTAPGGPFFDRTLNFLQAKYDQANTRVGNLTDKSFKIADELQVAERELAEIRTLLLEEWRQRKPADPRTGEIVRAPFGAEEE